MKYPSAFFLFFVLTSFTWSSQGETMGVYLENDLFGAGTDQYYTSGIKISYSSGDLKNLSDSERSKHFLPLFDAIPFLNNPSYQKNLVFNFGQNIYTPRDTQTSQVLVNDRPYAGYTYAGFGAIWKNKSVRNSLILNFGVIGPASLGEKTQRFIHKVKGVEIPRGWDNELKNELGLTLAAEKSLRWIKGQLGQKEWELIPHVGAAFGNVFTHMNAGGEIRLGSDLPKDFGTSNISPVSSTSASAASDENYTYTNQNWDWYIFTRADAKLVVRNLFLDGNTFTSSAFVDKEPLLIELSLGAAIIYQKMKLSYALVYQTKEFETQDKNQVFGTIGVNWGF